MTERRMVSGFVAEEDSVYSWSNDDLAMWDAVIKRRKHDVNMLREQKFPESNIAEVEGKIKEGCTLWLQYLRLKTKLAETGNWLTPSQFKTYKDIPIE